VAAPAAALAYARFERRPARRAIAVAGCAGLLGLVWLHGTIVLSRPAPAAAEIRIGLVQGNIRQDEKWDPARAQANLEAHMELTRVAADRGARFVIWPESALPFYFDQSPELARELRDLARSRGIYLLFGNDDVDGLGPGAPRIHVGAKMLSPDGQLSFRYHKIRLVPFGEYVPLQPLLTLGGRFAARLVRGVGEFAPGTEPAVGRVAGHGISAFICYEAIFPDLVRQFRMRGAELLVNVTNDAWYGTTSAPTSTSRWPFRAVENGVWLVRAANTGVTAVVDPRGRVVERTALFERTVLVRDVPLLAGGTFYSRHGDLFGWTCLALAAALSAASYARR
jgi:apolipoprotein N-acyltransferase